MQEARVAEVELGALHQALADVGEEGRQLPDQERLLQDVHVAVDRVVARAERRRELGGVPEPAVRVGEHRPELPHLRGRHLDPEAGKVALDEGTGVGLEPVVALLVVGLEERVGEASPEPQGSEALRGSGDGGPRPSERAAGPGRRFGRRGTRRSPGRATGEAEPRRTKRPFPGRRRSMSPRRIGEDLGDALGLVEDDAISELPEARLGIGQERGDVARPLEIEVGPVGQRLADEGGLATLARSEHRDGGETAQAGPAGRSGSPGSAR